MGEQVIQGYFHALLRQTLAYGSVVDLLGAKGRTRRKARKTRER